MANVQDRRSSTRRSWRLALVALEEADVEDVETGVFR
jgi:hypothetical protein